MTSATGFFSKVAAAALAAVTAFSLAGCSQLNIVTNTEIDRTLTPIISASSTLTEGVLTVGINAENSPYGGVNSNNETVGLDVDIAAALASDLGLRLQIVDVNSSGKAALSGKQVDVALGVPKSGSDTSVAYTSAYINDGSSLFTLAANAENARKLAQSFVPEDDKVIVQANTPTSMEIRELLGIDAFSAQGSMKEAFEALEQQQGTFLAANAVNGDYMASSYTDIVNVGFLSADSITPIYAATLSDNVELTQAIGKSLETITSNGVLKVIVDKWLGSQGEQLMPGNVDIAKTPDMFKTEGK